MLKRPGTLALFFAAWALVAHFPESTGADFYQSKNITGSSGHEKGPVGYQPFNRERASRNRERDF